MRRNLFAGVFGIVIVIAALLSSCAAENIEISDSVASNGEIGAVDFGDSVESDTEEAVSESDSSENKTEETTDGAISESDSSENKTEETTDGAISESDSSKNETEETTENPKQEEVEVDEEGNKENGYEEIYPVDY